VGLIVNLGAYLSGIHSTSTEFYALSRYPALREFNQFDVAEG